MMKISLPATSHSFVASLRHLAHRALLSSLLFGFVYAKGDVFNITDYGAKSGKTKVQTPAIQRAIDACAAAGGGTVLFPGGDWLSGTLYLKSHVTLHLSAGATLWGSTEIKDYPENIPDYAFYGDTWVRQSLIYAEGQENVAIEGRGTIDGQGSFFLATTNKKPDRYRNRPYVLWFIQCTDVRVSDVHLQNSAMWMQHYLACDRVRIQGITVFNHANKNNDMIDIDGCRDVIISDCIGDTDDDALTFKSTSPRVNENITVTNCIFSSHVNAIKFGTETTGGFRNVNISNCIIRPSRQESVIYGTPKGISGLTLEMVDGGIMENVNISNIQIDGVEVPLFLRLGNRARKYTAEAAEPPVGVMRNIRLSNITATNAGPTGCSITGMEGYPIENVELSNIHLEFAGGGTEADARRAIPDQEKLYPEAVMYGRLNAYGLYLRHVKEATLNNLHFDFDSADLRPALVANQVENLEVNGLRARADSQSTSFLRLAHNGPATIRYASPIGKPGRFIEIKETNPQDIRLENNAIPYKQPIFAEQTIDSIEIGYGLAIGDVDGDGDPDILLADKKDFVWYRNPDWQRFVMVSNLTERDNVCIAARDLDGFGQVEVAVGAQWNPGETSDSTKSGSVHYLIRPKDPTQLWEPVALPHEPTTHRMHWVRVGEERYDLVVLPLHGRGNKGGEGEGVRIYAYEMPENPRDPWKLHLLNDEMHLTHNFDVDERKNQAVSELVFAGKEGLRGMLGKNGSWEGNSYSFAQAKAEGNKGYGEIRFGKNVSGGTLMAGIRAMHGNELVVATTIVHRDFYGNNFRVIADDLAEGHALACGDLLGLSYDQIVVGWRKENAAGKVGIRLYVPDEQGRNWTLHTLDDNTMACEDLKVADLNGDGKPEIIAAGRATKNVKIYWNLTK